MKWFLISALLLLVSCGGGGTSATVAPTTPPPIVVVEPPVVSSIALFYKQDDVAGYGGSVDIQDGEATFTSNTNPKCLELWMCRRVELSKKVTLPIRFSYSFEILEWYVDEYKCGTHKGLPKGCYVILHQFWNQQAAPRAYAVIQKKPDGRFKLSFHNKNDAGVVDYVWETYISEGIHTIEIFNDGYGASLTVNGETSGYHELDVTYSTQEYLKWGMYWQKEMTGNVVIKFSDVSLDE